MKAKTKNRPLDSEQESSDLVEYESDIKLFAENSVDFWIENPNTDHARIVFKHMLRNSDEILVFDDKIDGTILDDGEKDELESYFSRSGVMKVLLSTGAVDDEIEWVKKARRDFPNQFFVRKIRGECTAFSREVRSTVSLTLLDRLKSELDRNGHFAVASSGAVRIETKTSKREAVCNFHAPIIAKGLYGLFNKEFEDGSEL